MACRAPSSPIAVVVIHDRDSPLAMLEIVTRAILVAAPVPAHPCIREVSLAGTLLPRAELSLPDSAKAGVDVHVYAVKCGPLREPAASVSTKDALAFIIREAAGAFYRLYRMRPRPTVAFWGFGQWQVVPFRPRYAFVLIASLALSLMAIDILATAILGPQLLAGALPTWLTPSTYVRLTLDLAFFLVPPTLCAAFAVSPLQRRSPFARGAGRSRNRLVLFLMWLTVLGSPLIVGQMVTHVLSGPSLSNHDGAALSRGAMLLCGMIWLLAFAVTWAVRWFIVQRSRDILAYFAGQEDGWQQLSAPALGLMRLVYGSADSKGPSETFRYSEVVLVAHSFGSLAAYRALNDLILEDIGGRQTSAVERTRCLMTLGSPLEREAVLSRVATSGGLAGEATTWHEPLLWSYEYRPKRWINIWSPNDWLSGPLHLYDDPKGLDNPKAVQNIRDLDATSPFAAHGEYWDNLVFARLLYSVIAGSAAASAP